MTRSFRTIVIETGIAGGLLFAIHVSIPNCGNWPFIWPAVAGAAAFWLVTRLPKPRRLATGLRAALAAGVIAGVVASIGVSAIVYALLHTNLVPSIRQTGAAAGLIGTTTIFAIASSLGAIDIIVAFLGGVIMLPVRYIQTRHAHA